MKNVLFLLCLSITVSITAQDTYLHCGKLIDTKNGTIKKQMTLVVTGNKITKVLKGYIKPKVNSVDTSIDLTTKTVMPGFIDMHVHIEGK